MNEVTQQVDCSDSVGITSVKSELNLPIVVFYDHKDSAISKKGSLALTVFTEGSAVVKSNGIQYSIISPGCFCFNEKDSQSIVSSGKVSFINLFFHPSHVSNSLTLENIRGNDESLSITERQDRDFMLPFLHKDSDSGFIPMGPLLLERAVSLLKSLAGELTEKRDTFWPCRSRSYLLELLFLIFKAHRNSDIDAIMKIDDSLSGRILHFLHVNYFEKILIADLSRRFESNKTTINKLVRDATGSSVIDYVNRLRVQSACLLLRDTNLPVLEIAYRSGYNDTAHFGRMFKKISGSTPREYREISSGRGV